MILLTQQMRSLAYNQATILRPIRKQVDQTLQAPESRLLRVLILMRPRLVWLNVLPVREPDSNRIEGHNKILSTVDFLESLDDFGLLAHTPCERFVGDGVSQAHTLLVDVGKVILVDSCWVISLEAQAAILCWLDRVKN
jgi:hypothetical protein